MRLDTLVARPEHIFLTNNAGFCGSPIYGMDTLAMEDSHNRDIEARVRENQRTPVDNRAEVMAGETICADSIIRRETAREVTGKNSALNLCALAMWSPKGIDEEAAPVELLCANIEDARQASRDGKIVTWRTSGELSEVVV